MKEEDQVLAACNKTRYTHARLFHLQLREETKCMETPFVPAKVFCSYAEEDTLLLEQLERHLSPLRHEGLIMISHKRQIIAGTDWKIQVDRDLKTASLILLLVSPNFFASDYCYGIEMQQAMQRHEAGEARVLPILLNPVDWQRAPFGKLKVLPHDGVPATTWIDSNAAFADIAQGIRVALDDIRHLPSPSPLSDVWNATYRHDLYFTGRDQELERLHVQLQQRTVAAIGQIQSINGLGGVGKTALAIEYAYRYSTDYSCIFLVHADSIEALISSYLTIAALLNLPEKNAKEQEIIVQAVKIWLKTQKHYLLIFDNADELELLNQFIPSDAQGHFLITTRTADLSALKLGIVNPLALSPLPEEQGILFLLRRAVLPQGNQHIYEQARQLVHELDGLPLAIEYAGAYVCATQWSLGDYLKHYLQWGPPSLDTYGSDESTKRFMTTWTISFQRVTKSNPDAAKLLYLCAFLASDSIPETILTEGAKALGPTFAAISDAHRFNLAIRDLRTFSLIDRRHDTNTLTMHRVVQDVLRRSLSPEEQQRWKLRAVQIVSVTLPGLEHTYWTNCEKWLSHAFICAQWIRDEEKSLPIAPPLLNWAGRYLRERARYNEAERFLQHAHALNEPAHRIASLAEATDLNDLAYLAWCQGSYQKAEKWLLRAHAIHKGRLSYESLSIDERLQYATCLQNVACIHQTQGRYKESEALFQDAREQTDGAIVQSNLGELYRRLGRYEEADFLLKQALSILEQEKQPEELYIAYIFHKQALLSFDQKRYEEAERLFIRVRTIYEKCLGIEHPHTAQILHGLAEVYRIQSKYEEAKKFFLQALAILEEKLGREHSATAAILNGLALLYLEQGKEQGKYVYVKQEKCMKLGEYGEVEALFLCALDIRRRCLGQNHPDTALILHNLALFYYDQGKYKEAEEHFQRALAVWKQQLSPEHPYIVYTHYHLGLLYSIQKGDNEAEAKKL